MPIRMSTAVGPPRLHVAPCPFGIVLGVFHGLAQGAVAAGDQPDDRVERYPVGRRQLRGVGHGQTARRARTDVEHSSAALHPLDDPLDESFHRGNGRGHGIGHTAVFAVDARQQVVHRHPLQIVVGRSLFRYSDLFHM